MALPISQINEVIRRSCPQITTIAIQSLSGSDCRHHEARLSPVVQQCTYNKDHSSTPIQQIIYHDNRTQLHMSRTGNLPYVLLPPIIYKPAALHLLQPQPEPFSMVLRSVQGLLSGSIIKFNSGPPALAHAALLHRRYYTAPWRGYVLAATQGRPFHSSLPHNCQHSALARGALLPLRFYTATRQSKDLNSIQRLLFRGNMFGTFRPRQYCTAPPRCDYARSSSRFWWKITAAAAFINIMVSFIFHTYLVQVPYTSRTRFVHLETVPYTNRTHLVIRSPQDDLEYGETCFGIIKNRHSSKFLSPLHPDSVRVNLITKKLVPAIQRGLAIKSRDATLVHGSPCEDASLDVKHAIESKKQSKPCISQPQTAHLDGLNWEVIVVKNDAHVGALSLSNGKILVFTGLLNHLKTDAEIATVLAHEVAHVVARHWSESIIYKKWFPYPLKVHFLRRMEIEADHIGMLLLAAAGFDPQIAPVTTEKIVEHDVYHPSGKERAELLSRAKIMDEALELYSEVMQTTATNNTT